MVNLDVRPALGLTLAVSLEPVRAEISSTSCDPAIFVDQAADARLFSDAVLSLWGARSLQAL